MRRIEAIIFCWSDGEPFVTACDGFRNPTIEKGLGVGIICGATDVFESPIERENAAIVVAGPPGVLVAANLSFEPGHFGLANEKA